MIDFVNMAPWLFIANRVIHPDGEASEIDVHDHTVVVAINLDESSTAKKLIFRFRGNPYDHRLEFSKDEWVFELIFYDVQNISITPESFLPYEGKHLTADFIYVFEKERKAGHIRWDGDTNSVEPDPQIEFWSNKVEFKWVRE